MVLFVLGLFGRFFSNVFWVFVELLVLVFVGDVKYDLWEVGSCYKFFVIDK